jgi:hypothetical protein
MRIAYDPVTARRELFALSNIAPNAALRAVADEPHQHWCLQSLAPFD